MWTLFLESIYLIFPGIIANATPVLVKKINFLNTPIDFGRKFMGEEIFGSHKTYRGFFFGIISAILAAYLQLYLFRFDAFKSISLINYSEINILLLGFLGGFGVLFGDLVKSFFKRRVHRKPGKPWFPFDQLDALVGGLIFVSFVYIPPWKVVLLLIILAPVAHIFFNHLGYYLHIKKEKW